MPGVVIIWINILVLLLTGLGCGQTLDVGVSRGVSGAVAVGNLLVRFADCRGVAGVIG